MTLHRHARTPIADQWVTTGAATQVGEAAGVEVLLWSATVLLDFFIPPLVLLALASGLAVYSDRLGCANPATEVLGL